MAKTLKAEIAIKCDDVKIAEAVTKAVSPDNFKVPPGLSVKTKMKGQRVLAHIRCKGKFQTFIATVDDLLFAISLAEKNIKTARKLNMGSLCQLRLNS
ncbi:MAG: KEOPS complex subunit Pcc1 [Candidatus Bathyarchaeia archaeon]